MPSSVLTKPILSHISWRSLFLMCIGVTPPSDRGAAQAFDATLLGIHLVLGQIGLRPRIQPLGVHRLGDHVAVEGNDADAAIRMAADAAGHVEALHRGLHGVRVAIDAALPAVPGDSALDPVGADVKPDLVEDLCVVVVFLQHFRRDVVVRSVVVAVEACLALEHLLADPLELRGVGGPGRPGYRFSARRMARRRRCTCAPIR